MHVQFLLGGENIVDLEGRVNVNETHFTGYSIPHSLPFFVSKLYYIHVHEVPYPMKMGYDNLMIICFKITVLKDFPKFIGLDSHPINSCVVVQLYSIHCTQYNIILFIMCFYSRV